MPRHIDNDNFYHPSPLFASSSASSVFFHLVQQHVPPPLRFGGLLSIAKPTDRKGSNKRPLVPQQGGEAPLARYLRQTTCSVFENEHCNISLSSGLPLLWRRGWGGGRSVVREGLGWGDTLKRNVPSAMS